MNSEASALPQILVVDDEVVLRRVLDQVLTEAGYEVSTAENGRTAIESIKRRKFDLIITDIVMPGVNGIDVLRAAKKEDPLYPVIMITGYPSGETAAKLRQLGASDYISKPFSLNVIRVTVANVLEKSKNRVSVEVMNSTSMIIGFDEVTNAYSASLFSQMLDKEIGRSRLRGHVCSLLAVEIDDYEQHRETKAEVLFDELVRTLADIMNEEMRPGDTIGRTGDARFTVILPETDRQEAVQIGEKMTRKADWEWSISVGVASYPGDAPDSSTLIGGAYDALRVAKSQTGGKVVQMSG